MDLWDLIFPPRCAVCGRILKMGALCAGCRGEIVLRNSFFCAVCRARVPGTPAEPAALRAACHPRPIAALGIAADYAGPVSALVRNLKFDCVRAAAGELGALIFDYLRVCRPDFRNFAVLPVPLHPRRLRERGFNQAELIAAGLARALELPLETGILVRIRPTEAQSLMPSSAARAANLRGSFRASGAAAGRNFLLVDDVVTSGATLFAAAEALKQSGAGRIIALAAGG